jgi:hypothetical protein
MLPTLRGRISSNGWAVAAIVAAILLANAPYLVDAADPNPLPYLSGLAEVYKPGPVAGQSTVDPSNGYVSQALGRLAAEDIIHGHLPWWNPNEGTGNPLFGEIESAALFPPTLLNLIGNGQLYERILLELIGALSTFALLRRLGLNRTASVAGGVLFGLNGTYAWFAYAAMYPVAFLPLMLLGIERAYAAARLGARGGWRLLAIAAALSAYAGFPETTYIDALLAVVWFLWRCGSIEPVHRRAFIAKGAMGGALALLLAAPFIVAGGVYASSSYNGNHANGAFGAVHLPGASLPMVLMPYVYGPILGAPALVAETRHIWSSSGGYLSIAVVMLGCVGLFARGRRGLRIVLAAWIVLVFSRMYGQVPLLGHVLGVLPGMDNVAFYRYADPVLELPVIILVALGIHDVMTVEEHRRLLLWAGLGALGLIAIAALGAHSLAARDGGPFIAHFWESIAWGAFLAVAAIATGRVARAGLRGRLLVAIVAVDALVLFMVPELSAPQNIVLDHGPTTFLRTHLGLQRFYTLYAVQPNYGSYYGEASLNLLEPSVPLVFARYSYYHLDRGAPPTHLTGTPVDRFPGTPSPQAELVSNVAGFRAAAVSYVLQLRGQTPLPAGDFKQVLVTATTVVYRVLGAEPFFTASGCTTRASGYASVLVDCPRPTTLVRRETDLSGWSAAIDGRSVPIHPTTGVFQAVTVPTGTHRVTFSYAPPAIVWAEVAFLLGILGIAVGTSRRGRGMLP